MKDSKGGQLQNQTGFAQPATSDGRAEQTGESVDGSFIAVLAAEKPEQFHERRLAELTSDRRDRVANQERGSRSGANVLGERSEGNSKQCLEAEEGLGVFVQRATNGGTGRKRASYRERWSPEASSPGFPGSDLASTALPKRGSEPTITPLSVAVVLEHPTD